MSEAGTLSNKEKAQVALGAAVGAGCRICAENLYPMLRSLGATEAELERILVDGLAVRESATEVMRRKAGALLGRVPEEDPGLQAEPGTRLEELIRTGAAVAANCAPDAMEHIERAKAAGATGAQIEVAVAVGRTVRTKAQNFSDEEIAKSSTEAAPDERAACCGPMSMAGTSREGGCC